MGKKDKRVDAYIAKAAPFAQPILKHLRELVHKGCPEVEETIKWGMPSFEYKGPYCGMASFKQHAVFGFWKSKLLEDPKNYLGENKANGGAAMGNLGCLATLKDLPPDKAMLNFIRQAKKLNDEGVKVPKKPAAKKADVVAPAYFITALKKNQKALATYNKFSPSNKREYVEWVTEAKTEETRQRRLETAVAWMAEGKIRNWKYVK
ncbi:MAG: YdeI/OmpD-associated family protein [Bacteroidota bacterium]